MSDDYEGPHQRELVDRYRKLSSLWDGLFESKLPLVGIALLSDELSVEVIFEEVLHTRIRSRKALCEALDIGESTLSGWKKDERVPRSARLITALFILLRSFEDIAARQSRELERIAKADRLVRDGDQYLIASFTGSDYDGSALQGTGNVIARGIASEEHGHRLLSYQKLLTTIEAVHKYIQPSSVFDMNKDGDLEEIIDAKTVADVEEDGNKNLANIRKDVREILKEFSIIDDVASADERKYFSSIKLQELLKEVGSSVKYSEFSEDAKNNPSPYLKAILSVLYTGEWDDGGDA